VKPYCKTFWSERTFFRHHNPSSAPKSSETALSHIFFRQCKVKQLKGTRFLLIIA